jgi:hypothetical protein
MENIKPPISSVEWSVTDNDAKAKACQDLINAIKEDVKILIAQQQQHRERMDQIKSQMEPERSSGK